MNSHAGQRLFAAGCIVLIAFGAVHVLAVYKANFVAPTDPKVAELQAAEKALVVQLGPLRPSAFGVMQILNASYSVLLLYAGVMNLLALRPALQAGRLRGMTMCALVFVGLLLGITIVFQFPPPMLFAAVAWLCFAASWVRQGRGGR